MADALAIGACIGGLLRRYLQPYFHRSARAQRANLLQFTPILSAERMHFVRVVPANLKAGTFRRKCMRSGSDSTGTCSTGLYSVFYTIKGTAEIIEMKPILQISSSGMRQPLKK